MLKHSKRMENKGKHAFGRIRGLESGARAEKKFAENGVEGGR